MEVTVIGTGYVGTVTGACLAYLGHHVTCVDTDASKIARLQRGESPIYEPQLEQMMALAAERGGLDFTTELAGAVRASDVIFIAVGTPPLPSGEANLAYLEAAAKSIGAAMDGSRFRVVVNKSTVPVGSGNLVETLVREGLSDQRRADRIRFGVASNPEFLREGSAVADSLYPDRIVVGGDAGHAGRDARTLRTAGGPGVHAAARRSAPVLHDLRAAAGHVADQRGNDQVRRQCVPGDEDRLRQRDRQHLRARRARRVPK